MSLIVNRKRNEVTNYKQSSVFWNFMVYKKG